jgi:hypothetical protein
VRHARFVVDLMDEDVGDGRIHFGGAGLVLDALVGPDPSALRSSPLCRSERIEVGHGHKIGSLDACAPLVARHDEAH